MRWIFLKLSPSLPGADEGSSPPPSPRVSLYQSWLDQFKQLSLLLTTRAENLSALTPGERNQADHVGLRLRILRFLLRFYSGAEPEKTQVEHPQRIPKRKTPDNFVTFADLSGDRRERPLPRSTRR